MENNKFPVVPKDLLEELERRFPDRMPPINTDIELLRAMQGQVTVVKYLRHQFNLQNQTILE